MTASGLRARIESGGRLLGALLRLPNSYLTELAGLHGFDFVIFDCEHGPADIGLLLEHILVSRAVGLPVLVRLPGTEVDAMLRVLDAGATGLLVPRVSTAADIRRTIEAASYPPNGSRGFAVYSPAGRYGMDAGSAHLAAAAANLVIIAMIEDGVGVENAAEIAAVPALTGILVGPADLSVSLGHQANVAHPEVVSRTAQVHQATRAAGVAVMVIVGRPAAAAAAFEAGAQLVLVNVAQSINDVFAALTTVREIAARQPTTVSSRDLGEDGSDTGPHAVRSSGTGT